MEDEILNNNFDDDSETENYSLNESSDVSTDEECDSILTTVQMSSSNCFIGKNGYKWNKNHAIIGRTRSHNIITHLPGLKGPAKPKPNCGIDIFNLFFTAAIIKQISEFTNAKIEEFRQRISDLTKSTYSNFTSEIEIRAFLGLLYLAGVYKSGHENVESLFASDGTGRDIFRSVMSVKRFLFLLLCIRFDNFKTRCKEDRLSPIRDIFQTIIEKFQSCYTPAEYLTVDEMLVGFRGKCPFKIYIPSKPNKYGIKIVILADSRTHYMYNAMVYTGKSKTPKSKELSLPTQIVLDISRPIWKSNINITADNWFTSIELVDKLKEHGLTYLGTMRKNKPQIPPQFQPHPKRESGTSIFGFSGTKTLVSYVPKKKKIRKPDIIMDYNLTKGGVDTIDQMVSNFSTSRRSRRWPLALFYALLDITALNSYIIFNYQIDKKDQKERSTFIVDLGRSLIDEHLATRNLNSLPLELQTTIKKFKNNDGSSTSRGSTMPQESATPKRCYKCPSKNAGKVKTLCSDFLILRLQEDNFKQQDLLEKAKVQTDFSRTEADSLRQQIASSQADLKNLADDHRGLVGRWRHWVVWLQRRDETHAAILEQHRQAESTVLALQVQLYGQRKPLRVAHETAQRLEMEIQWQQSLAGRLRSREGELLEQGTRLAGDLDNLMDCVAAANHVLDSLGQLPTMSWTPWDRWGGTVGPSLMVDCVAAANLVLDSLGQLPTMSWTPWDRWGGTVGPSLMVDCVAAANHVLDSLGQVGWNCRTFTHGGLCGSCQPCPGLLGTGWGGTVGPSLMVDCVAAANHVLTPWDRLGWNCRTFTHGGLCGSCQPCPGLLGTAANHVLDSLGQLPTMSWTPWDRWGGTVGPSLMVDCVQLPTCPGLLGTVGWNCRTFHSWWTVWQLPTMSWTPWDRWGGTVGPSLMVTVWQLPTMSWTPWDRWGGTVGPSLMVDCVAAANHVLDSLGQLPTMSWTPWDRWGGTVGPSLMVDCVAAANHVLDSLGQLPTMSWTPWDRWGGTVGPSLMVDCVAAANHVLDSLGQVGWNCRTFTHGGLCGSCQPCPGLLGTAANLVPDSLGQWGGTVGPTLDGGLCGSCQPWSWTPWDRWGGTVGPSLYGGLCGSCQPVLDSLGQVGWNGRDPSLMVGLCGGLPTMSWTPLGQVGWNCRTSLRPTLTLTVDLMTVAAANLVLTPWDRWGGTVGPSLMVDCVAAANLVLDSLGQLPTMSWTPWDRWGGTVGPSLMVDCVAAANLVLDSLGQLPTMSWTPWDRWGGTVGPSLMVDCVAAANHVLDSLGQLPTMSWTPWDRWGGTVGPSLMVDCVAAANLVLDSLGQVGWNCRPSLMVDCVAAANLVLDSWDRWGGTVGPSLMVDCVAAANHVLDSLGQVGWNCRTFTHGGLCGSCQPCPGLLGTAATMSWTPWDRWGGTVGPSHHGGLCGSCQPCPGLLGTAANLVLDSLGQVGWNCRTFTSWWTVRQLPTMSWTPWEQEGWNCRTFTHGGLCAACNHVLDSLGPAANQALDSMGTAANHVLDSVGHGVGTVGLMGVWAHVWTLGQVGWCRIHGGVAAANHVLDSLGTGPSLMVDCVGSCQPCRWTPLDRWGGTVGPSLMVDCVAAATMSWTPWDRWGGTVGPSLMVDCVAAANHVLDSLGQLPTMSWTPWDRWGGTVGPSLMVDCVAAANHVLDSLGQSWQQTPIVPEAPCPRILQNVSAFVIKTGSTTQWQANLAPKEMAASDMRNRRHVQLLLTRSTNAAHPVSLDQELLQGNGRQKSPSVSLKLGPDDKPQCVGFLGRSTMDRQFLILLLHGMGDAIAPSQLLELLQFAPLSINLGTATDLLHPDNKLLSQFQEGLKRHLVERNEKLTLEIQEMKKGLALLQQERGQVASSMYELQKKVATHRDFLQESQSEKSSDLLSQRQSELEQARNQHNTSLDVFKHHQELESQLSASKTNLDLQLLHLRDFHNHTSSNCHVMRTVAARTSQDCRELLNDNCRKYSSAYLIRVIAILLIIGGVELNPGLPTKKQTTLSTVQTTETKEVIEDDLKSIVIQIHTELRTLGARLETRLQNIEQKFDEWDQRLTVIETSQKTCLELATKNDLRIKSLEDHGDMLDRKIRENNLIFYGIKGPEAENSDETLCKLVTAINEKMQIQVESEIMRCHRLSKKANTPILVEISKQTTRIALLRNSYKLRDDKIFVNKDYTLKTREQHRLLISKKKELSEKGIRSKLRDNKLLANGQKYQVVDGRVPATKTTERGRGSGGIIVGVKKGGHYRLHSTEKDNIWISIFLSQNIGTDKPTACLIFVYLPPNELYQNNLVRLTKYMEKQITDGKELILFGDLNIRTGGLGGLYNPTNLQLSLVSERKARDLIISPLAEGLLEFLEDNSLTIINGRSTGDRKGDFTYVSERGSSTIDYCIVSQGILEKISDFRIETQMYSDHLPLILKLTVQNTYENKYKVEEYGVTRYRWTAEGIKTFKQELKELQVVKISNLDSSVNTFTQRITEAMSTSGIMYSTKGATGKSKPWFDKSCYKMKKLTKESLKEYRRTNRKEDLESYALHSVY
ncbi:hypothetical protein LAZ67_7002440 [Cordylochernes scorpioides]|uniref:PiggyBac transposable element-derived protein domain-containing protein n=1 Tax=Cordylochernes scorpioides TaxID=51811 RepID=A0ABY6KRT3_9ARAC|nr:hypothetical protein LAZ67_7002440 [Cordylochernes scorpioides]